jgi:hypothetical protein
VDVKEESPEKYNGIHSAYNSRLSIISFSLMVLSG